MYKIFIVGYLNILPIAYTVTQNQPNNINVPPNGINIEIDDDKTTFENRLMEKAGAPIAKQAPAKTKAFGLLLASLGNNAAIANKLAVWKKKYICDTCKYNSANLSPCPVIAPTKTPEKP